MKINLIHPSIDFKESFLEALQESHKEGTFLFWDYDLINNDFDKFISSLLEKEIICPISKVPETIFWAIKDNKYVGRISIRHELTSALREKGGHIGYDIRPTYRKLGIGTKLLDLGLLEAQKLGLTRVLLTADDNNYGSHKIIESNSGILEKKKILPESDIPYRYYWISINAVK